MADPSAVEQIVAAVTARAVLVPGIRAVSRDGVDALSVIDFPAVIIAVESDDIEKLMDAFLDRTLNLSVTPWVQSTADISKVHEAFKAEVRKTMAADPRLGMGDKLYMSEGPSSGPFPMSEDLTQAAEVIRYSVRYRTTLTDPFTLIG